MCSEEHCKTQAGMKISTSGRKLSGFSGPATPVTGREEPQLFRTEELTTQALAGVRCHKTLPVLGWFGKPSAVYAPLSAEWADL